LRNITKTSIFSHFSQELAILAPFGGWAQNENFFKKSGNVILQVLWTLNFVQKNVKNRPAVIREML
jgi:hypothetical protein